MFFLLFLCIIISKHVSHFLIFFLNHFFVFHLGSPNPDPMLLDEEWEWRQNGIVMSRGWEHYDQHLPEAHVLLFRRVLGTDPRTGEIPLNMAVKVQQRKQYVQELEQRRQRMMQERQESMAMEY